MAGYDHFFLLVNNEKVTGANFSKASYYASFKFTSESGNTITYEISAYALRSNISLLSFYSPNGIDIEKNSTAVTGNLSVFLTFSNETDFNNYNIDSARFVSGTYTTSSDSSSLIKRITVSDYTLSASGIKSNYIYLTTTSTPTTYNITQTLTNCSSNISDTTVEENTELSFTLTPNDNYYFETTPTITVGGTEQTVTVNDDKTATCTLTATGDIVVIASATEIPITTYTGTYNLTNVTCNQTRTEFEENSQYTFSITKPNDSNFDYVPYIEDTDGKHTFSLVSDSVYVLTYTVISDFSVNGSASDIVRYILTQNLTNCTSNISSSVVEKGETVAFVLTPTTNYEFKITPSATMGSNTYSFTLESDGTATLSLIVTDSITITGIAETDTFNITYSITNCEINSTAGTMNKGDSFTFQIDALVGYEIEIAPTITDSEGSHNFVLNEETGLYEYTYTAYSDAQIVAVATDKTVGTGFGYINIYVVDEGDLTTLAQERIVRNIVNVSTDTTNVEYVDTSEYLLLLSGLYVDIPATDSDYINYGGYHSSAVGQIPDSAYLKITSNEIEITELYNNSIDYKNTSIEAFLPFIGTVNLDTACIMGGKITITYIINIVTGDCTAKIINSINGYESYYNGNVSFKIPFKYNNMLYNDIVFSQGINANGKFTQGDTPYITVVNNNPDTENFDSYVFGLNCDFTAVLNTVSGYSVLEAIELVQNENMFKQDIDAINAIVKSGVIL